MSRLLQGDRIPPESWLIFCEVAEHFAGVITNSGAAGIVLQKSYNGGAQITAEFIGAGNQGGPDAEACNQNRKAA